MLGPAPPSPWSQRLIRLLRARDAREARQTLLAVSVLFFIITGYLVAKPVRDALFLHRRRFDEQPVFYLLTAVATLGCALAVNVAASRLSRRSMLLGSFGLFTALFLGFRLWLAIHPGGAAETFLIFVSVYSVLAVYLFWALVNDLFTAEQASRLYGPIGAGGALGSIVGASMAGGLARPLGTENLLFVTAGLLVVATALIARLEQQKPPASAVAAGAPDPAAPGGEAPPPTPEPVLAAAIKGLRDLLRSPYLGGIAAIVVLVTFTGTLFNYQFSEVVQRRITGMDDKTAFFGRILIAQNLLAFLVQLLVVAPVQRRWGPLPGLLSLAALQLASGVVLGLVGLGAPSGPPLWLAAALVLPMNAVFYSIHQSSKELLYAPLGSDEKYRAKVFADTFGFRLGDALGALLLLGGRLAGVTSAAVFVLVGLPITLGRIWVSWRVAREFRARSGALVSDSPLP